MILVALTGYRHEEDRQHALAARFAYHLVSASTSTRGRGLVMRMAVQAKLTTVPSVEMMGRRESRL